MSPQEELGQVAAVGPSAQGMDCSPGGPQCSPKQKGQQLPPRFAPVPQEAALGRHPLQC